MSLDYEAGDIILDLRDPFAKALFGRFRNRFCNNCFSQKSDLKPCASCGLVKYCDETCEAQDLAAGHKFECKSQCFRKHCQSLPDPDRKNLLFRIVSKLKLNPDLATKPFPLFNQKIRCFNDLIAHQNVKKSVLTGYQSEELARRINDEDPENKVEIDYLLRLWRISHTYSYGIFDDENKKADRIGWGIFIEPAIFDHSCKPNAYCLHIGAKVEVRAIGPVPKGESPRISYHAGNLNKASRNQELQETFHFQDQCHCETCESESDSGVDYIRLRSLITGMKKLVARDVPVGNWEDIHNEHEEILKMLRQIYHEYDERITNQFVRIVDIAIQLADDTEKLKGLLEEALDHLVITFGEDHLEYKEFQDDIASFIAYFAEYNDRNLAVEE